MRNLSKKSYHHEDIYKERACNALFPESVTEGGHQQARTVDKMLR